MKRRRPRIGIHAELLRSDPPKLSLATRYVEAVRRAGGLPYVLPPLLDAAWIEELLDDLDGLLLSGGDDFDTERLGLGPTHPAAQPVPAQKQDSDLALVRGALGQQTVTLGVCYGMQLLGLADGATLFQDLPSERPQAREHRAGVCHSVHPEPGTKLERIVEVAPFDVVSRHHQALAQIASPWRVSARDEEGLIEAIERPDLPFAHGVQWHPELSQPGGRDDALFKAFVQAAGQRADARGARVTELERSPR